MTRLKAHGIRWELPAEFAPTLEKVLSAPALTVKESPVKLVAVHEVDGVRFYVKRYRHFAVPLRPLKFLFKPSQGRREWALAQRLAELGAPIVRHVAYGERWSPGGLQESIVVTEEFPGVPLDRADGLDWSRVTEFVRRLHRLGVLQRDLHPGNILARMQPLEFRLVDMHGIVIRTGLSQAERDENLATIAMGLPVPVPPDVARLSQRLRRRHLRHYARRCLRQNREFTRMRLGGVGWQVRLPFLNDTLRSILGQPDEFLAGRQKVLKAGLSSTVGAGGGLVVKRFNFRKFRNLFVDLVRPSRARRAFLKAYHLELAGISTPRALAAGDRRVVRFLKSSYMIMEAVPGAIDLSQWPAGRGRIAAQVARLIAKLHEEGFRHRDLKETNILIDEGNRPYLIDLEGLSHPGRVTAAQALADLERLARGVGRLPQFTRADRQAFLRAYCKARRLPAREFFRNTAGSAPFPGRRTGGGSGANTPTGSADDSNRGEGNCPSSQDPTPSRKDCRTK